MGIVEGCRGFFECVSLGLDVHSSYTTHHRFGGGRLGPHAWKGKGDRCMLGYEMLHAEEKRAMYADTLSSMGRKRGDGSLG